jgi:hypothetical protein
VTVAKEEVKAERYTCDGCGSVHLILTGEELPYGWHGSHMNIGNWGGNGGTWFACKRGCILKAMDASEE